MKYEELKRLVEPDPSFHRPLRELSHAEAIITLFSWWPLREVLFPLIDRYGEATKPSVYRLSVVVRWLLAMVICGERTVTNFRRRLESDETLARLVLHGPIAPADSCLDLPSRGWLSKTIRSCRGWLIPSLTDLHRELVRPVIVAHPEVRHGLVIDRTLFPTWGNPERGIYRRNRETGKRERVGTRPATDPDAHLYPRLEHKVKEHTRFQYGFALDAICLLSKPLIAAWSITAPRQNERAFVDPLLDELYAVYPELKLRPDELGVFLADAGYDGAPFFRSARRRHLIPVVPVKESLAEAVLKGEDKTIVRRGVELNLRGDYTPVCSQDLPLRVWTSDLSQRSQRFGCPLRYGECPKPCGLQPKRNGDGHVVYTPIRISTSRLDGDHARQHPLFPRAGEQHEELFAKRVGVERMWSLMKGKGMFGGEDEGRLPIRGLENMQLRFICTMIVLTGLALINAGLEPADDLEEVIRTGGRYPRAA